MGLKQKNERGYSRYLFPCLKSCESVSLYMFKNRDERKNNNVCINLSGEDFPSAGAYLTGVYASLEHGEKINLLKIEPSFT
jgi:hypothetical protein